MKTRHILSLAVLALMMAACSSDETAQQSAPSTGKVPFKGVINANGAGTRGLTEAADGKSISAKWEKDELVAVVHGKIVDVLSVESVDASTGAATVTGEITSATNGESVQVVYVGHEGTMVNGIKSDLGVDGRDITKEDITEAVKAALDLQDGTLDYINKMLDYRYGEAKLAVSGGDATFETVPTLLPQFAVWKLTLTNNGTTALSAKKLVMKKGSDVDVTIDLGTSTKSAFYIAFEPDGTSYSFEATVDNGGADLVMICSPTLSNALSVGKYYVSTLSMIIPVADVVLDKTELVLMLDDTYDLTATVLPDNATNKTVNWKSDNISAATVSDNGKVTAVSIGEATITATVGEKKATCKVTVNKKAGSISYETQTVEKETTDGNFTNKLTVVGDGKVTYSSDKESVATVNQNGQVTIKGAGETTITATVADSDTYTYAPKTATYKLKVKGGLTDYNVEKEKDW